MDTEPARHSRRRLNGAVVTRADLREVGSIDVLNLDCISKSYGRDFLPYPFLLTSPSEVRSQDEYDRYAASVLDRFNHGDLHILRRWAASYAYAEIRVECRVQYLSADTPSIRLVANRVGELGYLAKQRSDADVIDVYEVAPHDLGHAIAESVDLQGPGERPAIVIPDYVSTPANSTDDSEDFAVRQLADSSAESEVRGTDVTVFGTVQSHWRPTRRWGFDPGKNAGVFVRIRDDGEYIFDPDFSMARPLRRPTLIERIDKLIAEDVAVLKDFRNA